MGHTHLSFVVEITSTKSFIMYKLFVLAAVLAAATAEGYYPAGYAGCGGLGYAGLGGLYGGYGAYPGYGAYGYAAGAYAAPLAAAPLAAAPIAANYAVPAPRVLQEAPIVEQIVEPVEQWGYK